MTASGEVQTHEEATVYVKELEIFLTMKVHENTPAALSFGKLCDETGIPTNGSMVKKPHLIKDGIRTICNKKTRSYRGSRFVKFVLWIFINFTDTYETGEAFLFIFFTCSRRKNGKMRLTVTFLQCQCLSWLLMDQGNLIKSKPTKSKKPI